MGRVEGAEELVPHILDRVVRSEYPCPPTNRLGYRTVTYIRGKGVRSESPRPPTNHLES